MASEIFKLLDGLTRDLGVQRSNLYELLDHRLRAVWKVTEKSDEHNPELVREIVQWQLDRLINLQGRHELDARDQAIVRMSFNIWYPELTDMTLTARQRWFSEQDSILARNAETTRKRIKGINRRFAKYLEGEERAGTLPKREAVVDDIKRKKLPAKASVQAHTVSTGEGPPTERQSPLALRVATVTPGPSVSLLRPDPQLTHILQDLATKVRQHLEANEDQWQLNDGFVIPIRWVNAPPELASSDVSGLDLSGNLDRLQAVVDAVPSRRLVVLGAPGAGKTVLAEQYALQLLRNRTANRYQVPVVFSLASWDPKTHLRQWMAQELVAQYGFLFARSRWPWQRASQLAVALRLVDERYIFPIFDGLDEMAEALRPLALTAINRRLRIGEPMLLTSRPNEYANVVWERQQQLSRAAVVELHPLTLEDLRTYLPAKTLSAIPKWQPVLDRLAAEDEGTEPPLLFPAFATPLTVAMATAAYNEPEADPSELLELGDKFEVADHLFDKFVEAAYTPKTEAPGEPEDQARWEKDHATRSLEMLAVNMHAWGRHDHEWWKLSEDDDERAYVVAGFSWCLGLTIFEFALGLTSSWKHLLAGVVAWVILSASFIGPELLHSPLRLNRSERRFAIKQIIRHDDVAIVGLPFLLFLSWLVTKSTVPDKAWPLALWPLVVAVVVVQLFYVLSSAASDAVNLDTVDPQTLQKDNRLLALGTSVLITTAYLVVISYAGPIVADRSVPIPGLLGIGLCLFVWALLQTHWGRWQLRNIWVTARYKVHFQSLAFLADAHRRGILRRNGSMYRFRHGLLQDRLAARLLAHPDRKKPPSSFELPARYSLAMSWASVGRTTEALTELKSLGSVVAQRDWRSTEVSLKVRIDYLHMALDQGEHLDLAEAEAELRSLIDPINKTFGAGSYWLYRCRLSLTMILIEAWRFGDLREEYELLMEVTRTYYGENDVAVEDVQHYVWRIFEKQREAFGRLQQRVVEVLGLYNAGIPYSVSATGHPVVDGDDLNTMAVELRRVSDLALDMLHVHIDVFTLKSYLVMTLLLGWRFDEAALEYRVALDQADALLGRDHPAVSRWELGCAKLALQARFVRDAAVQTSLTR